MTGIINKQPKSKKSTDEQKTTDELKNSDNTTRKRSSKAKTGRNYLITLRPPDNKAFNNYGEETTKLREYVQSFAGFKYAIIGQEKNHEKLYESNGKDDKHPKYMRETGTYHYHILATTHNTASEPHLVIMRQRLEHMFPDNLILTEEEQDKMRERGQEGMNPAIDIAFADSRNRNTISYCGKEDNNPILINLTQEKLDITLKITREEKEKKKLKEMTKVEREKAIRDFVVDIMTRKGIKINYFTESFMGECFADLELGETREVFWRMLRDNGFLDKFTEAEYNNVRDRLFDKEGYSGIYPYYNPCIYIIKFTDGYINLKTGTVLTLEEGDKYLTNLKADPVTIVDESISYEISEISRLFMNSFNVSERMLRVSLREILKPPSRDSKSILIYGPTRSGKSILIDLYAIWFSNSITSLPPDLVYGLSEVSSYRKFFCHEISHLLKSSDTEILNCFKLFTEGGELKGKVKHSKSELIKTKNGIMASNTTPEQALKKTRQPEDLKALFERLITIESADTVPADKRTTEYRKQLLAKAWEIFCTLFTVDDPEE